MELGGVFIAEARTSVFGIAPLLCLPPNHVNSAPQIYSVV
jgi:hypothetical protein